MSFHKIGFIGLGLIGGSIAEKIKELYPDCHIIANAGRESTVRQAHHMGLTENDRMLPLSAFSDCDYIFLCAPTTRNLDNLKALREVIGAETVITDVGSTKGDIHEEVIRLGMQKQFIGGHPMTGSEKTGLEHANPALLENAYYIVTPTKQTPSEVTEEFCSLVKALGSICLKLDYKEHDRAVAAISHLPHMISYSLANMVHDIDDSAETMKTISAGSFRDMTRVAASSPVMWENICRSNKDAVLSLMDQYEARFHALREMVAASDSKGLLDYFGQAKEYRDSLHVPGVNVRNSFFEIYVDLADEAGGIAVISSMLAFKGINLKNIGIINNREFADGVLRIEFYDQRSLDLAKETLIARNYLIHERS